MSKLDEAKRRDEMLKERSALPLDLIIDQSQQIRMLEKVKGSVDHLYELMNDQEPVDLSVLAKQLETLNDKLDLSAEFKGLQEAVADSKVETVTIKQFSELLEAVKANQPLPVNIDLTKLEKAILNVQQRIQDASVPNQAPEDYTATRRVIKVGNRLIFDDTPTGGGRAGGGPSHQTDASLIYYNGNLATRRFAAISASSNGNNEIVAAVATKSILVLSYVLISNGTVNTKWRSANTDLSGLFYLVANTGASSGYNQYGHFMTATGEALNLNLSGGVAVGGHLTYLEI